MKRERDGRLLGARRGQALKSDGVKRGGGRRRTKIQKMKMKMRMKMMMGWMMGGVG